MEASSAVVRIRHNMSDALCKIRDVTVDAAFVLDSAGHTCSGLFFRRVQFAVLKPETATPIQPGPLRCCPWCRHRSPEAFTS